MHTGAKILLGFTAVAVLAIGGELGYIHYRNAHVNDVATTASAPDTIHIDDDDAIAYTARKERPSTPKDERDLIGKTIWVSAGGQMDYYKAKGKHADYDHPEGTLKGAEPLLIRDVFEQVPPKNSYRAVSRISAGKGHVLLAFTMPRAADPNQLYAVPVGLKDADGSGYTFLTDAIFFYDDPHELYKHWGAGSWAHVDKHECVVGMSEHQCMMALGQVIEPHGDKSGDRSVTFNNDSHPVDVVFVHDKATSVKPQS